MDEAFIEDAEHDVDDERGGEEEKPLALDPSTNTCAVPAKFVDIDDGKCAAAVS